MKILSTKRYCELINLERNFEKKLEEGRETFRLMLEQKDREYLKRYCREREQQSRYKRDNFESLEEEKEELQEKIISLKNKINILIKKIK